MNQEFIEEVLSSHPLLVCKMYSHLQEIRNERVCWNEAKVIEYINSQPDAKYSLVNLIRNSKNNL